MNKNVSAFNLNPKWILVGLVCLFFSDYAFSQSPTLNEKVKTEADFKDIDLSKDSQVQAILNISEGDIVIDLDFKNTPLTVKNFVKLCKSGFYDHIKFHRVIPKFVVQGGDPLGNGSGGPGYTIQDEKSVLKHEIGAISMANTGKPNSGGSQFFLVLAPQPHLDGKHTVFGNITQGLKLIFQIEQNQYINSCKIQEKPLSTSAPKSKKK